MNPWHLKGKENMHMSFWIKATESKQKISRHLFTRCKHIQGKGLQGFGPKMSKIRNVIHDYILKRWKCSGE